MNYFFYLNINFLITYSETFMLFLKEFYNLVPNSILWHHITGSNELFDIWHSFVNFLEFLKSQEKC